MKKISDIIKTVVYKRLSSLECDPISSNQHEFHGTKELVRIYGKRRMESIPVKIIYYTDDLNNNLISSSNLTWYDARKIILNNLNTDYTILEMM